MLEAENILLNRFVTTGDSEAFSQIVRQHAGLVYGVCLRILRDRDKAADAVQETFIQLLSNAGSVTGSLPGWLHRVATNLSIDRIRSDSSRRRREARYAEDRVENTPQWAELSGCVDKEMDALDEQTRDILIRHFFEGHTTRSIGRTMDISQATVSRRIESGVGRLRARLKKRGIIAGAAALSGLLAENAAQAAPSLVVKELGKIAIVGGPAAVATSSATASAAAKVAAGGLLPGIKAKVTAVAAIIAIGAGFALIYHHLAGPTNSPNISGGAPPQVRGAGGMMATVSVPPISELLDKYTQTLDATQSIISSYESSTISSGYLPPLNIIHRNKRIYTRGQRRTDGKGRIYHQAYYWGYNSVTKKDVPQDKGYYSMQVAAPGLQYAHNKNTLGQPDGVVIYANPRPMGWDNFRNESDAFFLGYLGVDLRIDIILKKAKKVTVRPRPEVVNDSLCYVVQADTMYGDYTMWLDSEHGFQPARIEASRGGNDIVNITKLQPSPDENPEAKDTLVIDNIKFKKVQDVWVPVEGHMKKHIEWPQYGFFTKDEATFKITEIELNPDHDDLNSFADPIKNPALDPELVDGTPIRLGENARHVWRNGKIIPQN